MRPARPLILLSLLLVLAACDRLKKDAAPVEKAPPAGAGPNAMATPKGFRHEAAVDVSGYFMPQTVVQAGNFHLTDLAAGAPSDFRSWEAGKREGLFGPLLLEFEDITSPMATNEMGGEHHSVRVRVLPKAYQMTKAAMAFHGVDPVLGPVTFAGAFNQKALAAARATGNSDGKIVLKGDLQVGDARFHDVAFTFWAGE